MATVSAPPRGNGGDKPGGDDHTKKKPAPKSGKIKIQTSEPCVCCNSH